MPQDLTGSIIGKTFIELQSVDSTNNYAMALIHEGLAQHGLACFTHEQTAGKGQRGKNWVAEKGANIAMSIILQPMGLLQTEIFQLSACIAVAVRHFLSNYAGDEITIKWPNDIYWCDRKAAGILIENIFSGNKWSWAVAGIGININQTQFPAELPNPVSLKQISGKQNDILSLAKELCQIIDQHYSRLSAKGFKEILEDYNQHLYLKNQKTRLRKETRVFEALVKEVTASGELITNHGIDETFSFGQVEWLLPPVK